MSLFADLKRRNVIRMAGVYLVGSWLIAQVAGTILPVFDVPNWVMQAIVLVLATGLLPALVFAWVFELTPQGLKRDREVRPGASNAPKIAQRMNLTIIALLILAVLYFGLDKFVLSPRRNAALVSAVEQRRAPLVSTAPLVKEVAASIAVLPFVNMSSDKEQDYFSDGISEDLLNLLAKIPQLRVTARTSSFSFKGKDIAIPEIARKLHVAHVLEGSVRKSGNTVRISAELVDAATDTQLWSRSYDRKLDDIFAIQDEIAADVIKQLKITLLGAPKAKVVEPDAYRLFLKGRQLSRQTTAESLTQAIAEYRHALTLEPGYAAAWSGLSDAYVRQADHSLVPIEQGYRLAREAANKALALDPNSAAAHAELAWVMMPNDLASAARHLTRALAQDPNDADALRSAAFLAMDIGQLDSAVALGESMIARDPLGATSHANLGFIYLQAGRPDSAINSFRTALALSPGENLAHVSIGMALLQLGHPRTALAEVQKESSEPARLIGLTITWHALGNNAASDAALAAVIQKYKNAVAYWIAVSYAYRGETDHAFAWLYTAVANRDPGLSEVISQAAFAQMHDDPRWLPLLRKVGKAPAQLAKIDFKVALPEMASPD